MKAQVTVLGCLVFSNFNTCIDDTIHTKKNNDKLGSQTMRVLHPFSSLLLVLKIIPSSTSCLALLVLTENFAAKKSSLCRINRSDSRGIAIIICLEVSNWYSVINGERLLGVNTLTAADQQLSCLNAPPACCSNMPCQIKQQKLKQRRRRTTL